MSKNSEKQNQSADERLHTSQLMFASAARVRIVLAVVFMASLYGVLWGHQDLTAGSEPTKSATASIKLVQPDFSPLAAVDVDPVIPVPAQRITHFSAGPGVTKTGNTTNLRLIAPSLVDSSESSSMVIQPRLAGLGSQSNSSSTSNAHCQQVAQNREFNDADIEKPELHVTESSHTLNLKLSLPVPNGQPATRVNRSHSTTRPLLISRRIDKTVEFPVAAAETGQAGRPIATSEQVIAFSQTTGLHGSAPNAIPLIAPQQAYGDPLTLAAQSSDSKPEIGSSDIAGPKQPVPMVPHRVESGNSGIPLQLNLSPNATGTGFSRHFTNQQAPQNAGVGPGEYGNSVSTIEAIPLESSAHSKAYSDVPPTGVPRQSGHTLGTMPSGSNFGHSIFNQPPGTSGFRATVECDATPWMAPYTARAMASTSLNPNQQIDAIPPGYEPWWNSAVKHPVNQAATTLPVDVRTLLQDAMLYSPQVTAIKTEPEVQYRVITQEEARFDWTAFLEATYDNLNDPVGNDLTTGNGQDRLLTQKFGSAGGIRRKNIHGGDFRVAQNLGHENQNSRFFVPNNQGSARLELSYRQPLLDGAGRTYNESEIVLARIQANASEDEVVGALQSHLIEVTEAYWTLYRAKAEFFQRQKLLASSQEVLEHLEGRSQVDTIPRQVLRARAAVARAQTRTQRTFARVKDSETQLRLLVNSPGMLSGGPTELMPMEAPGMVTENADLQSVLQTALVNRPDISEAIRKMRAAGVRLGVSRTELLPRLDLLVETYVADLAGNSQIGQALRGELQDNRPGYTFGLEFEIPVGNRAAKAKLEQRQWELKRSINIFRATVEKSLTDVEIANREVRTAYSEISSRYQSMEASVNESRYLKNRFEVLPASEDSAILLLEDLLDSFERLADEESAFVQAQVDHAVALVKLKKELGVLLKSRNSRPDVANTQKQWMQGRLESTVQNHIAASAPVRKSSSEPVAVPSHPGTTAFVPISSGHELNFDVSADSKSSTNPADIPVQTRPMPMFPTTWDRQPDSSRRPTRP